MMTGCDMISTGVELWPAVTGTLVECDSAGRSGIIRHVGAAINWEA